MPALAITVDIQDGSNLDLLEREMTFAEKAEFADQLAGEFEELTRSHIREAAKTRHTTAERLGAKPTNYLLNKAASVESVGAPGKVLLTVAGDIFKRAFGPVKVSAVAKKYLTIPITAAAYGRRAGEFDGLFLVRTKKGNLLLAQREGKTLKPFFLLKAQVTLPEDRGLLPSDAAFFHAAEEAADAKLELITRKVSSVKRVV